MDDNNVGFRVSSIEPQDAKIGENKENKYRPWDAMTVYDENTDRITERPQLIREYLTEMLESRTHQWYYSKDRKKQLDDIKCIVRILEMLEE